MRALTGFALGFGTAVLLSAGAAYGSRLWLTAQYRADQAQWRRIPIGFVVESELGLPEMVKQGAYSHVAADITEKNFPLSSKDSHIANMGLFAPKQEIGLKTVLENIAARKDGAPRAATMEECLQYGDYIAALKSRHLFSSDRVIICAGQTATVNGACVVPQLWSVDYGLWNLGTTACDSKWSEAEFLVVYTKPPSGGPPPPRR